MIVKLHSGFDRLNKGEKSVAAVGARPYCVFEQKEAKPSVQKNLGRIAHMTFVPQIIASSMMIPIDVWDDVGPMEESLFIDGVDHEWCWRAGAKGYSIAICESAVLPHRLGTKRGVLFGLNYKVAQPVRLYYQFRNILLLARRGYVPTYWKLRHLAAIPVRFLLMILFEPPRVARLRYMLRGVVDGLTGHVGKYRER